MNKIPLKDLIDECKKSKKKVNISTVAKVIEEGIGLLYNQGTVLKRVEKKVGEEDFNILLTSLISTIMGTLYANATFKTQEELIEYGKKIGATQMLVERRRK